MAVEQKALQLLQTFLEGIVALALLFQGQLWVDIGYFLLFLQNLLCLQNQLQSQGK